MKTTTKEKAVLQYYSQCSKIYRDLESKMHGEKRAHQKMDLDEFREMLPKAPRAISLNLLSERDREFLLKIYVCLEANFVRVSDEWTRVLLFSKDSDPIRFCVKFGEFSDKNFDLTFESPKSTFTIYDPWKYHRDYLEIEGESLEIHTWIIQASRFMNSGADISRVVWQNYCKILDLLGTKEGSLRKFGFTYRRPVEIGPGYCTDYDLSMARFFAKAISKEAYPWT